MLEDFIFSANAVLPIFLVIAVGYLLRRSSFLSTSTVAEMNRLVFTFALPILLFRNIFDEDFDYLFNPSLIIWVVGSTFACFVLLWLFAEIFLRKKPDLISSFVQGSFRANYAIVGLPLVANILGDRDTGMAALAAAFIVTSYNVLSVIVLTAKDPNTSLNIKNIILGVCKNPSIIGIATGVAVNLLNIPIPGIARESINYIAALCTPMALLAVGGSINILEIKQFLRPAIVAAAMKIVIAPLIFVTISIWLGFRGEELVVLFVMLANPTAIISYVMAARMNGNAVFTSAIILITTAFSSVTLTVGVYVLRVLGVI